MGATHVTVAVANPAKPSRRWSGLFLVDTGSTDCYVPKKHLRAIGIKPLGKRTYELADGTEQKVPIGVAQIEFMGEIVGTTVLFGENDAEPGQAGPAQPLVETSVTFAGSVVVATTLLASPGPAFETVTV